MRAGLARQPVDGHTRDRYGMAHRFSAYWHGLHWFPFGNLIFRTLTRMFFGQDERATKHLAVGLRHKPSSMFLGDADMPAKWYDKLKAAHLESVQTGRPFNHPLTERVTLRWRS